VAHTYRLELARTSSAANPITAAVTIQAGDTVACLMLKGVGGTSRAPGAPTLSNALNTYTFIQAGVTQKAVTSPECSAEMYYVLNPLPGSYTLSIPNTGTITCKITLAIARANPGGRSSFGTASGGNGTTTNPNAGTVNAQIGDIVFSIVASGADTWAPSSQTGTIIANTDDGTDGGGEQYSIRVTNGNTSGSWTFGTSDDWGGVVAVFREIPPNTFQNFMGLSAGDGISVSEKSYCKSN
jgi:hypothetical protein